MDPVDHLIVDEWASLERPQPSRLVLVDAPALLDRATAASGQVTVWCDDLRDLADVPRELWALDPTTATLRPDRLQDADAVWMRLPRSVQQLRGIAATVAGAGAPDLRLVAGGRVKHMTRSMNDALSQEFEQVQASRGRQKSRVLHASGPRPSGADPWERAQHDELHLTLCGAPGVFAGARVDVGTRLLVAHLDQLPTGRVHDLGCGNGTITALLARDAARTVTGSDVSASAVVSTRATLQANGVDAGVQWADGLAHLPASSLDAIITNPPFHLGAAKESAPTLRMFDQAARVLRPGGEFWCVFNSHLPWRHELSRRIGPTRLVDQNTKFSLSRSVRRPR